MLSNSMRSKVVGVEPAGARCQARLTMLVAVALVPMLAKLFVGSSVEAALVFFKTLTEPVLR